MTDAAKSPVTRSVTGESGQDYIVTVTGRHLTMHPKRSRNPSANVLLPWDSIYTRGLLARAVAPARPRRRVTRGLLST